MTDSQLLLGIIENDERAWGYICRNMKFGFTSIVARAMPNCKIAKEDIEDIFQESRIVLMQKAKSGGVVVVDVGINRLETGLVGDVDFDNVKDKCSFITPVPGGVGPMTITMLMKNTVFAAKNQKN